MEPFSLLTIEILYIVCVFLYIICDFFAFLLLAIYCKKDKKKNTKFQINIQLCLTIIISSITVFIPRFSLYPHNDSLLFNYITTIQINMKFTSFALITFILLYSYFLIEHTEFIQKHGFGFKYGIMAFIWIYAIVMTPLTVIYGENVLDSVLDYQTDGAVMKYLGYGYFGIMLIIQILSVYKIYKSYKENKECVDEEVSEYERRNLIKLGVAEIILLVVCSAAVAGRNKKDWLWLIYLSKIFQYGFPCVLLLIYSYDEDDFNTMKSWVFCKNEVKDEELKNEFIRLTDQNNQIR